MSYSTPRKALATRWSVADIITKALASTFAVALVAALLSGCDKTTNNVTAPPPPGSSPTNNSVVKVQAAGICPAAGPCIADFSVTLASGWSVKWVFTGAAPPISEAANGQVSWASPGSGYPWSSNVCNGAGVCAAGQGTVTFTSSSDAASIAVSLALIEPGEAAELVEAFDTGGPLEAFVYALDRDLLTPEGVAALVEWLSK